jgi:hypothetical protein
MNIKLAKTALTNPIIGFAGITLAAGLAQAQLFTYNSRDLVAEFRKTGSSDVEIDLGSIDSFTSLAPSQIVDLTSRYSPSLLSGIFGGFDSLTFSVIGTHKLGISNPTDRVNTSWLTVPRSNPDVESTAPFRYSNSKSQNISSDISGILGDGSTHGALVYAPSAGAPSTSTAIVIPTTGVAAPNSFTTLFNGTGGLKSLVSSPGIEKTTPASFTLGVVRSDLYESLPGSTTSKAAYLGVFTLESDGVLTFQAVPEPGEYGVIFGGLLLGGAAWLRRQKHRQSPASI